jgi:tetratricopeptide (TPR) repeat protein
MKPRSYAKLLLLLGSVALTAGCGQEDRAQSYLQRGLDLYDRGDLVKAQLEFRNVLQIDPKDAQAWFMLGKIAEQQEEWRNAYSAYSKTVELSPENLEARAKLGTLLLAGNDIEGALAQAEAVLAAKPADASALALRGFIRVRQGDLDAALVDAESALAQAPQDREALALLAQVRLERKDMLGAKQALEIALAAHPEDLRLMLAMAGINEQMGDTAGTRAILERLIEREPKVLDHRTRLAQYLAARGETAAAVQTLRDAVVALPEDRQAKLLLVELQATQQGVEVAAETLGAFIAAAPDDQDLRFALGSLRMQAGDSEQAQTIFREIIAAGGDSPAALQARGKLAGLLLAQERLDEAGALANEVLAKDAQDSDALLVRAAIALQSGDPDTAIGDLRTLLRNNPESIGGLRILAEAHAAREELSLAEDALKKSIELSPDDPAGYLQLAGLRQRSGDLEGAGVILDTLMARDPNSAVAQTALARIQQSQPDTDALNKTAEQVLATRPDHPLGHYLKGLVAQRRGEIEASVPHFETALDKEPKAAEPLVALTRSYLALERYDQAEERLRRALEADADSIVATNLLGEVYIAAGNPAAAREEYARAIEQRPGAPLAYERLANVQLADGDAAAAVATLEAGIEATKASPLLVFSLPMMLEQAGRYDQAIEAYENLLATNPTADAVANNLAVLLANHRADEPADLSRALGLAQRFAGSEQSAFLDTLGWVYYRVGEYQQAAEILEKVQASGETTPERQYHLGMAYLKLGRADEAKSLLTAAVATEQPYTGLDEAKAALNTL